MKRSDFLRTLGRGAVVSTGMALGGRLRVLSKETPDAMGYLVHRREIHKFDIVCLLH
jgi:hypothetical protein